MLFGYREAFQSVGLGGQTHFPRTDGLRRDGMLQPHPVDAAKELIREGDQNFTEIAASLCFGSSQYFTTVFKRVSGMTPTEYRASALHR